MSAGGELAMAGLTVEIMNGLVLPMMTIPYQGMDRSVSDLEVEAAGIRTGEAIGVEYLFAKRTTRAFPFGLRDNSSGDSGEYDGSSAERAIFWSAWAQGTRWRGVPTGEAT